MTVKAAVDIGTNSMRLLIVEDDTEVGRWARVTGLGKGVDSSGRLSEEAIERTLAVLADYGEECRRAGVHRLRAVATSASRDAANSEEFLSEAHLRLGVRPEVISGIEEASLAYSGAVADAPGDGPFLVIDIGGGSTEFVWSTEETITAVSTHIGSVRLTDRVSMDRPATFEELHSAAGVAERILGEVAMPEREWTVLGVAGTWTSLSAINLRLSTYDRTLVHHSTLDRRAVDRLVGNLASLTIQQTAAIPALDPARAPVILAGSIIAREAMRTVGASEVIISEHDLLDGLVASM